MIMNNPLWWQEMWKAIWAHLQEPEADLTVFHVPAHKISTPPGKQEADALAKICTLANDLVAVDNADWLHQKCGHDSAQGGWSTAKKEVLELTFKGSNSGVSKGPSVSLHICQTPQAVRDRQTDHTGPLLLNRSTKYALVCVDTDSGLTQAFPCWWANHVATIKGLKKLSTIYGYPYKIVTGGSHISKDMIYKYGQKNMILNGGSTSPMIHKQWGCWEKEQCP